MLVYTAEVYAVAAAVDDDVYDMLWEKDMQPARCMIMQLMGVSLNAVSEIK